MCVCVCIGVCCANVRAHACVCMSVYKCALLCVYTFMFIHLCVNLSRWSRMLITGLASLVGIQDVSVHLASTFATAGNSGCDFCRGSSWLMTASMRGVTQSPLILSHLYFSNLTYELYLMSSIKMGLCERQNTTMCVHVCKRRFMLGVF